MAQTLFYRKWQVETGLIGHETMRQPQVTFGVEARVAEHDTARRLISLKSDLGWAEVADFQRLMRSADFWSDFPEPNLQLVRAEFQGGDVRQRIDLLYLRNDGGIIPCELKVGGTDPDTHGQLIRYLADLANQAIDKNWVLSQRRVYLERQHEQEPLSRRPQLILVDLEKFRDSVANIPDNSFRLLRNEGIIIDEDFPDKLVTAVRFLNTEFGFALRLLRAQAFVADDWTPDAEEFAMRLEFNDVEVGYVQSPLT